MSFVQCGKVLKTKVKGYLTKLEIVIEHICRNLRIFLEGKEMISSRKKCRKFKQKLVFFIIVFIEYQRILYNFLLQTKVFCLKWKFFLENVLGKNYRSS